MIFFSSFSLSVSFLRSFGFLPLCLHFIISFLGKQDQREGKDAGATGEVHFQLAAQHRSENTQVRASARGRGRGRRREQVNKMKGAEEEEEEEKRARARGRGKERGRGRSKSK